ncbi:benzoate/H(+) symporter BenE family transporter [Micromonospora endolithica]|uniref:Benzoate transporter BenE n=1 Tax=Micromonospora endolithica TaxID=230091 RepID=A0A3A9ZKA5_9ACTN|nr:benzoate/H(+) symporter BenE family transporter [Micromonospora endolithica]RKN48314.1 benzoate transporter BenE [Micromonospora endolithica]TWJ24629.1 benzoate membrane transport protein [Micromonospora endolithica]
MAGRTQPLLAGAVTALVGFASSFTVVLAGLRAVGATDAQAASGLLALCVASGASAAWLGLRHRLPMSVAWSTPGAALLVANGPVPGGWPVAVGAFLVAGLLIVAAGLVPPLGRAVAAIPKPIAGAMLAGVLLPLCTAPVRALVDVPRLAVPVVVAWLLLHRYARRWAVPGALAVAVAAIALTTPADGLGAVGLRPAFALTTPAWSASAVVGLALPLFLVTMAAQNVPGMAVLVGYGYRPPFGAALRATGLASVVAAPAGGHAVNLAAITAALAAGPDAHPDPDRRWIASVTAGLALALLGLGAGVATALVALAPPVLIEAVAGLALLGALATALTSALADPDAREAAVVTFVVTASGVTLLGIGGAFWGLVAGGLLFLLFRRRPVPPPSPAPAVPAPAVRAPAVPAPAVPAPAVQAVAPEEDRARTRK